MRSVQKRRCLNTFKKAGTEMERQRTTGKLLATQGYVIGVEISGSGSRQSVALANLDGNILSRVRHPLEYVPGSEANIIGVVTLALQDV